MALLASLSIEDTPGQTVYVRRACMDFLISHMPIDQDLNEKEEKIRLVGQALQLLSVRDFALIKKFFTWI